MKKRKYIAGIAIIILLIAGAAAAIRAYDRKKTQEAIDSIEQEILILCYRIGPGCDVIPTADYGYFIDKYGNKCYFDITEQYYYKSMDIYKYLEEHMEEYEKIPFLEEKQVLSVYWYLNAIDSNAEWVKVSSKRSMDVWSCYGYRMSDNGELECIFLEKDGGMVRYNSDENAEKVLEIIGTDAWWEEQKEIWNRFWQNYVD